MASNHKKTRLDHARDELMSHVVRCEVLDARMKDRRAWLDDTMEYMRDRHPSLGELELAQLEMIGRQFIKPAIPHGAENTARNRPEPTVRTDAGETVPESALSDDAAARENSQASGQERLEDAELQPA